METVSLSKASAFTHNAELFALVSLDGRLRIWDTVSGKLIHEFSPKAISQSSCTCLCWTRNHRSSTTINEPLKKRKKKKEKEIDAAENSTLAIGTTDGHIITFDINTGEGTSYTQHSNQSSVKDIAYSLDQNAFYTCSSNNRYIHEWDNEKQAHISKWKGDKIEINTLCVSETGKTLLSGGTTLKLWDLQTKKVLQCFSGHSAAINVIHFTNFQSPLCKKNRSHEDDGFYFLSGSSEERTLSVWHINSTEPKESPVATFLLSDPPVAVDTFFVPNDEKPLKICAACQNGKVHVFENILNGKTRKPITCTKTINFMQSESKKSKPVGATIMKLMLKKKEKLEMSVVFGPNIKPIFETLELSELKDDEEIVKDISNYFLKSTIEESKDAVIKARTSQIKNVIGSTNFLSIPSKRVNSTSVVIDVNGNESDRQKTETDEHICSLEERLNAVTPKETKKEVKKPSIIPTAGSFTQMLIQAIHTNDDVMLSEILFTKNSNETVLKNTIKRLPSNLVPTLLENIIHKLRHNPLRSRNLTIWLRLILGIHLVYLLTNEEILSSLGTLYQHLKEQQEIQPQLANIQGKISFLINSSFWRKEEISDEEADKPAVVFCEDDSDDNETEDLFASSQQRQNIDKEYDSDDDVIQSDDNSRYDVSDGEKEENEGVVSNDDEASHDEESDIGDDEE